MTMARTSTGWVLVGLAIGVLGSPAWGGGPVPVSPGSVERFSSTASACPTFSWSAVEGTAGYELVVYSVSEADAARLGVTAEPVIRHRVPAGAHSWTPPAESCLAPAGTYAWSVRALGGKESGGWSESALFRVSPAPSMNGLAAAVERAVGRYLTARRLAFEPSGELAALLAEELAGAAAPAEPAPAPAAARPGRHGLERASGPQQRGVVTDDVELWLEETGSGSSDKVQLVFATPAFDGDPSDAWAIVVDAYSDALDPGKMFFSTPSFFDALQLFTDGTAIVGDQRWMRLLPRSSPPVLCTGILQEGIFYWDSDVNTLCVCDGSSWKPIDSDSMVSCS